MKTCTICKKSLSLDSFHNKKSRSDGKSTICKVCKKYKDKVYRAENLDKIKIKRRDKYHKNKAKVIEQNLIYIKNNKNKCKVWAANGRAKLKKEVFSHYSCGEPECKWCKEKDIAVLTIDHINGDGSEHRKNNKTKACGINFYRWLKTNNYPEGLQVLCYNCQYRKRLIEISSNNPTKRQKTTAKYVRLIKLECMDHYGGRACLSCGEKDIIVLTLDHVNDDGASHKKKVGCRGFNLYLFLRKNKFPDDPPLQVLCMNCNIRKRQKKYDSEKNKI